MHRFLVVAIEARRFYLSPPGFISSGITPYHANLLRKYQKVHRKTPAKAGGGGRSRTAESGFCRPSPTGQG